MGRWQRHRPPFSGQTLHQAQLPGQPPLHRAAQERLSLPLFAYILADLCTFSALSVTFYNAIHARGDTVRLRSHHNLRNLASLDHTRSAQGFETRIVDQVGVVDEETQACDAALYALYVLLAPKGRHHF